jgi:hypothetical protein
MSRRQNLFFSSGSIIHFQRLLHFWASKKEKREKLSFTGKAFMKEQQWSLQSFSFGLGCSGSRSLDQSVCQQIDTVITELCAASKIEQNLSYVSVDAFNGSLNAVV